MKIVRLFLVFTLVYSSSIYSQVTESPDVTVEELKAHIYYLASEELGGRKPGTEGGKKAAEYLRKHYKQIGLQPLGDNYFQFMDVTVSVEAGQNNSFTFPGFSGKLNEDFSPMIISSSDELTAPFVFVGYGFQFENDSLSWDSYESVDVEGKWVIILRGAPEESDAHSAGKYDNYSSIRKKALTARDNKAAGVIFVSGKIFDESDELYNIENSRKESAVGIPVIHLKRSAADMLLKDFEVTIEQLEASLNDSEMPNSFESGIEVSGKTEIVQNTVPTQNIIGFIEGSDPVLKNEYVLIGGHYDHLGMGGVGSGSRRPDTSAIHFGADDNASGTAAVVEIAEKLSANKSNLKRSIIVMNFAAEEMGLIGSKFFSENPLIDLSKIKFMINLDMVGRMNPEEKAITIGGTGTAIGLADLVKEYAEKHEIKAQLSPEGYGPSDHATFYAEDIPVLFAFTGIHDDYHTPADVPEKINYEEEKLVADMLYDLALDVINRNEALVYQEAGPKVQQSPNRKYKVTLGIMPDVAGTTSKGLRADAVIEGRPAQKAGMQKGDVIVALDGKAVGDIYDYMNRLADFKPGQRITVDVMRGEEKVILIVEL